MVPSILGMTGALAGLGSKVTIVTSTPSRLDDTQTPEGVELLGPLGDLESYIQGSERSCIPTASGRVRLVAEPGRIKEGWDSLPDDGSWGWPILGLFGRKLSKKQSTRR